MTSPPFSPAWRAPLPVDHTLPALREALAARGVAVLQAPPGAGKTTRVPLLLRDEPWLRGARVVMLEPRRLAARAAAAFMARTLGERVGETVGHRVRGDTRVGPRTRVEVVTEGVLTRMLQHDPTLDGVGLVIFDEFHERSLHADLGLALALQSRELLRDDLRLLVMSATLDGAAVAALLGDAAHGAAPLVSSEGRAFPVETRWRPPRAGQRVEGAVAAVVQEALQQTTGDVLAFLPGAAEIRRAAAALGARALGAGVRVFPLHGTMPADEQDAAIAASPLGRRKVVLATSIAETSLTIDGVTVVVDGGLSRVPRFSARTGMTRLETVRVSRASADQRRGRAGRTAPGVCYRLWEEHAEHGLVAQSAPEVLEADLAPLALELAQAGVRDAGALRWLDVPPPAALAQARELLRELGALDAEGRITAHGTRMNALAVHPRVAHLLLEGERLGHAALACDLAALLGERDVLRADGPVPVADADMRLRLDALRDARAGAVHGLSVDAETAARVRREAAQLRERLRVTASAERDTDACGLLLAFAYPDRIARRRAGQPGRYLLRNGGGAALNGAQALTDHEYLVVAETDGRSPEGRVWRAAPLTVRELEQHLGDQIVREAVVEWDAASGSVHTSERERLGAIVLAERPLRSADATRVAAVLRDALAQAGVDALPWSESARRTRERLAFLHALEPERWPDVSDEALAATLDEWLGPSLTGMRRRDEVARLDLGALLLECVPWEQRRRLDELAPTHVAVPSGSRLPVDYAAPEAPALRVRLQEMFGLADGPRVGGGRVPLTLHLLSPAQRPVQVTRDLAGFWRSSYFDVRRELRGRYPRHHWPENPMEAEATARAKRRGG